MTSHDEPRPVPLPSGLGEVPAAFRVIAYDRLASTNDTAKRFARAGADHGLAIWAREQTAGRGRQGRAWCSPQGNLYLSVVLRPAVSAARVGELSFVAAVAAAGAIAASVRDPRLVSLKWPNDILVADAKAAGILMEAESAVASGIDWVVLGLGINIASAPVDLPYPAAALVDYGGDCESPEIAARVLVHLDDLWRLWLAQGFPPIRERWLRYAHPPGTRLTVRQQGRMIAGEFLDLDADGTLILLTEDGPVKVNSGDVFPVAPVPSS